VQSILCSSCSLVRWSLDRMTDLFFLEFNFIPGLLFALFFELPYLLKSLEIHFALDSEVRAPNVGVTQDRQNLLRAIWIRRVAYAVVSVVVEDVPLLLVLQIIPPLQVQRSLGEVAQIVLLVANLEFFSARLLVRSRVYLVILVRVSRCNPLLLG